MRSSIDDDMIEEFEENLPLLIEEFRKRFAALQEGVAPAESALSEEHMNQIATAVAASAERIGRGLNERIEAAISDASMQLPDVDGLLEDYDPDRPDTIPDGLRDRVLAIPEDQRAIVDHAIPDAVSALYSEWEKGYATRKSEGLKNLKDLRVELESELKSVADAVQGEGLLAGMCALLGYEAGELEDSDQNPGILGHLRHALHNILDLTYESFPEMEYEDVLEEVRSRLQSTLRAYTETWSALYRRVDDTIEGIEQYGS